MRHTTTTVSTHAITRSCAQTPHSTPPFYLHLFVYLPFHRVSWFSASLIFRGSSFFLRLCHVFSVTLLSIFTLRTGEQGAGERRAAYSCQTASVLQLLNGSCDAGDAAEGFWCPANSAIFCPYPAWSVRQWWTASVSQRRCWVGGKNETGGGAPAETLYDALVIRCRLVLLVSRGAQWEQSLPLSAAPSWWQASGGRQMPTQCP